VVDIIHPSGPDCGLLIMCELEVFENYACYWIKSRPGTKLGGIQSEHIAFKRTMWVELKIT